MLLAIHGMAGAADETFDDEEFRQYRREQIAEVERQALAHPESSAAGRYFCTIYYTPKESGFTAGRGFDPTPASAPGLGKRQYAISFLRAVKLEGFGRLRTPVNGCAYLQYSGRGEYRFARAPLGSRGERLIAKKSCAVARENAALATKRALTVKSDAVQEQIGNSDWTIADAGHGLHPRQIDLYWGEDEPLGASHRERARPAGCRMEYAFDVTVEAR